MLAGSHKAERVKTVNNCIFRDEFKLSAVAEIPNSYAPPRFIREGLTNSSENLLLPRTPYFKSFFISHRNDRISVAAVSVYK